VRKEAALKDIEKEREGRIEKSKEEKKNQGSLEKRRRRRGGSMKLV